MPAVPSLPPQGGIQKCPDIPKRALGVKCALLVILWSGLGGLLHAHGHIMRESRGLTLFA